jgi:hypothetical protein
MGFFSSIGGILKKAAPIVAGVVGGPLAGLAAGAATSLFGGKKKAAAANTPSAPSLSTDFSQAIGDERTRRNTLQTGTDQALAGLGGFQPESYDAGAAVKEYAGGALDTAKTAIGDQLQQLRSQSGRGGHVDTGYFDRDQGEVIQRVGREFANAVSGQAVNAAGITSASRTAASGQRLGALESAAGIGAGLEEGSANRYADLLSGGLDRQQAQANADAQRKATRTSGILGLIGGIGKTVLPYILKPKGAGG